MLPPKRTLQPDTTATNRQSSPMQSRGLLEQLQQNVREVEALLSTNERLRCELLESQRKRLESEKSAVGLQNAGAIQQARVDALEQKTRELEQDKESISQQRRTLDEKYQAENSSLRSELKSVSKSFAISQRKLNETLTTQAELRDENEASKCRIRNLEREVDGLSAQRGVHEKSLEESQRRDEAFRRGLELERLMYTAAAHESTCDLEHLQSRLAQELASAQDIFAAHRSQETRMHEQLIGAERNSWFLEKETQRLKKEASEAKYTASMKNTAIGVITKAKIKADGEVRELQRLLDARSRELEKLNAELDVTKARLRSQSGLDAGNGHPRLEPEQQRMMFASNAALQQELSRLKAQLATRELEVTKLRSLQSTRVARNLASGPYIGTAQLFDESNPEVLRSLGDAVRELYGTLGNVQLLVNGRTIPHGFTETDEPPMDPSVVDEEPLEVRALGNEDMVVLSDVPWKLTLVEEPRESEDDDVKSPDSPPSANAYDSVISTPPTHFDTLEDLKRAPASAIEGAQLVDNKTSANVSPPLTMNDLSTGKDQNTSCDGAAATHQDIAKQETASKEREPSTHDVAPTASQDIRAAPQTPESPANARPKLSAIDTRGFRILGASSPAKESATFSCSTTTRELFPNRPVTRPGPSGDNVFAPSDFTSALPRSEQIPHGLIAVNKHGQRLDAFVPAPSAADQKLFNMRTAKQKLCNNINISIFGRCQNEDVCPCDHRPASEGVLNALKRILYKLPCKKKGDCRSAHCWRGHACQEYCMHRGGNAWCKYDAWDHDIDLQVAEYVTPAGPKSKKRVRNEVDDPRLREAKRARVYRQGLYGPERTSCDAYRPSY